MSLDGRLERLQRQNRMLTGGLVVMAGIILGMAIAPRPQPPAPPSTAAAQTTPSLAPALKLVASMSPDTLMETPATATARVHLEIHLSPPARGVSVWLDGRLVGVSSSGAGLAVDTRPGPHLLTVGGAGFARLQHRVVLPSQGTALVDLPAWRLASLVIESQPSHSHVVVNGPEAASFQGETPWRRNSLRPGRYRVEVSHAGQEPLIMVFHLPPGCLMDKLAVLPDIPSVAWVAPVHRPAARPALIPAPKATEMDDDDDTSPCPSASPWPVVPGVKATAQ